MLCLVAEKRYLSILGSQPSFSRPPVAAVVGVAAPEKVVVGLKAPVSPAGLDWGPPGGLTAQRGLHVWWPRLSFLGSPSSPQDAPLAPASSRQARGWAARSPVCLAHRRVGAADAAVAAVVVLQRGLPRHPLGQRPKLDQVPAGQGRCGDGARRASAPSGPHPLRPTAVPTSACRHLSDPLGNLHLPEHLTPDDNSANQ